MSDRYARHHLIPSWEQEKLTQATVIIIGLGALGNEVSRILAMAGVGRLILCDFDSIETSNLSRTLLFRPEDLGKPKAIAAAQALGELNPEIILEPRPLPLIHGVGLGELRDAHLVIGCLDSRRARLQLTGRCQLVQAPYLDGGTHPWGGEVQTYLEAQGPCYACSLSPSERSLSDIPWSCLDTSPAAPQGAAIPSTALVGTWCGAIAIRYLLGLSYPRGILKIDSSQGTNLVQPQRDINCPLHHPLPAARKIDLSHHDTVQELRRNLPLGSVPQTWEPLQSWVKCSHCGWSLERWGLVTRQACPQCQHTLIPKTTLDLDQAPEHLTLASLGVAPQEILPVRLGDSWSYVELGRERCISA